MNNQPVTVNFSVKISADGKEAIFTYDNHRPIVQRGKKIKWVCENKYAFAVHVGWHSPLEKESFRAEAGNEIIAKVLPGNEAVPGRYEYFVAVYIEEVIWTDDPDFIIPRHPGG